MTRMTAPQTTRELTLEDYLALPETMARQEVVDGVITPLPTPTVLHQRVLGRIFRGFDDHVSEGDLGVALFAPLDVLIRTQPKLRTRQPDLIFVGRDKIAGLDLDRMNVLRVVPDIAVEILAPSETAGRWAEKLADYAAIGVRELWLVDADARTVEVLELAEGRYRRAGLFGPGEAVASAVLPGLGLAVDAVFG